MKIYRKLSIIPFLIWIILFVACKAPKNVIKSQDETLTVQPSAQEKYEVQKIVEHNARVRKLDFSNIKNDTYEPSNQFDHLAHIRENSMIGHLDFEIEEPKFLIDYIIKYVLKNKADSVFLTDRSLLRKLHVEYCDTNHVIIKDKLLNGKSCIIELKAERFNEARHKVTYRNSTSESKDYKTIDGKYPFGGPNGKINRELVGIYFTINQKPIKINKELLPSINEPNFCEMQYWDRPVEAYEDGEYIYVYIGGGNAAGTYLGKFVFDQNRYITSIFVDYGPLSKYGSFGKHFIGF